MFFVLLAFISSAINGTIEFKGNTCEFKNQNSLDDAIKYCCSQDDTRKDLTKIIIDSGTMDNCVIDGTYYNLQHLEISESVIIADKIFNSTNFRSDFSNIFNVSILCQLDLITESSFSDSENLQEVRLPNVLSIGDRCFVNCRHIQFVDIPNVKSIGVSSFEYCLQIKTLDAPNVETISNRTFLCCEDLVYFNTSLRVVPSYAFYRCNNLVYFNFSITEEIGSYSFYFTNSVSLEDCEHLTFIDDHGFAFSWIRNVTIPNIQVIPDYCFYTTNLMSVHLGDKVELIGKYAFSAINNLEIFEINSTKANLSEGTFYLTAKFNATNFFSNLTVVPEEAFGGCLIEEIELDKVQTIDVSAFSRCIYLKKVILQNVSTIKSSAFAYCYSLETIDFPNVEELGDHVFYDCRLLTSATFNKLQKVGSYVFHNCKSLRKFNPNVLREVGDYAFYYCSLITDINLSHVENISNYCFCRCETLSSIDITDAKSIGNYAFEKCSHISHLSAKFVTSIGDGSFKDCDTLETIDFPNLIYCGNEAFQYVESVQELYFPKLKSCGNLMIEGCSRLRRVTFGEIEIIPSGMFQDMRIEEVITPKVTEIGDNVFELCRSLREFKNENITKIGNNFCNGCSNLETISLPIINEIGNNFCSVCSSLKTVQLPTLYKIGDKAFMNSKDIETLEGTPKIIGAEPFIGFIEKYEKYENFISKAEKLGDRFMYQCVYPSIDLQWVKEIGSYAFANSSVLENVTLCITEISDYMFKDCTSLRNVCILTAERIGSHSFDGCPSLQTLTFPYLINISSYAFYNCVNLEIFNFSDNIINIEEFAFSGCVKPKVFNFSKILSLKSGTFKGCSSLQEVYIHNVTEFDGDLQFSNCGNLKLVHSPQLYLVNESSLKIFENCKSLEQLNLGSSPPEKFNDYVFDSVDKSSAFTLCLPKRDNYDGYYRDNINQTKTGETWKNLYVPIPSNYEAICPGVETTSKGDNKQYRIILIIVGCIVIAVAIVVIVVIVIRRSKIEEEKTKSRLRVTQSLVKDFG
ncbi:leucine-rich repeat protein [Histomonas meleagridis]|uniref:leucine-rich repeat protein n=1 Tax=Histomonas meleagridis TaxID=135588 RepID=UPI00355A89F6|nr:leucine-rich repeat protein [Histomonas meleagridis]KAH0802197.1 leucine-rich repeat protein [Histomonas meleagridis]